uniref:Uncharacterized protein n=1 Tax=Utricularia reniformis TaxID=192314 RepID=A0A1Y0B075_9LAMI|nr:hypothetical protein AEK19_MT0561 [Utricularia reniformis]ART30817.1 hypothetical protein AEK19_MT0561 [Utricularia reniformis]
MIFHLDPRTPLFLGIPPKNTNPQTKIEIAQSISISDTQEFISSRNAIKCERG